MRVAIVGAGYAGVAVAWNFWKKNHEVTLFDGGEGASHVSTGLLHHAPNRRGVPILHAEEGIQATLELLEAASVDRPVFVKNGILRIAVTEEQKSDLGADRIWIPNGITVYSRLYLEGLKKACSGIEVVKRWVKSLEELSEFDAIVLTAGAETLDWGDLPLKKTIGQCLICRWKEPLKVSLLSYGHITPTEDDEYCLVGSTYEHTEKPDPKKALELLDKAALFYPPAKDFEVVEIRSGVRIAPAKGELPLIHQINAKTWVFAGLGSRGLIYHALFAKSLIEYHMGI